MTRWTFILLAAAAFFAFAHLSPAAAQAEEKTSPHHCLNAKGAYQTQPTGVKVGEFRGRTVCANPVTFRATILDTDCGKPGGTYRPGYARFQVFGNQLYCVVDTVFWERRGFMAAKVVTASGPVTGQFSDPNHCTQRPGFLEIVGTLNGSTVCRMQSTGLASAAVNEDQCVRQGAAWSIRQFGNELYCVHTPSFPARDGHGAALITPVCDIRFNGAHVQSLPATTEAACRALATP